MLGAETTLFNPKDNVPADRQKDIIFAQFVCDVLPQKKERNRSQLAIGGDRTNYPGDYRTPTAYMITMKLLLNMVVLMAGAAFITMDRKTSISTCRWIETSTSACSWQIFGRRWL